MKTFQVITDSTSDLIKKDRDQYGIDYFKMIFTIEDTDYEADLDWTKLSPDEYYTLMRNGKRSITSLPLNTEFDTKFRKYLDEGLDVLFITCSSKLSGTCDHAKQLADELSKEYPNRKILVLDSLRSNYAEGMIAIKAAQMANDGLDVSSVYDELSKELLKYQVHAIVGSLEWLKKAGRVKASTAFFGGMLQIKPIICSDAKGNNFAYEKVMGRKKSIERLIQIVCERVEDPKNATIYVEHANCADDANYFVSRIKELVNPKEIHLSNVGPIIGATVGPDTITCSFYGKEVDFYDGQ